MQVVRRAMRAVQRRRGTAYLAGAASIACTSATSGSGGVLSITVTASGSPLATAGHIHLAADHPEGYDRYSPMTSRLLHLTIIDILATCMALRIGGERLQPLLKEMKNNLRSKRYA